MTDKVSSRVYSYESQVERIQKFNLMNNVFMSVVLNDVPASEHVLRVLTAIPDLRIKEVHTQFRISSLTSHDTILDVLAEDTDGTLYNIEIQRADTIDHSRRTRYYASMMDGMFLEKGQSYAEVPETYILYVSEKDLWDKGETYYPVKKYLTPQDKTIPYDDGIHIVYINAEVDDGSEIAKLMNYFKTADPEDMSQGALSERVQYLKRKGGMATMYDVAEEFREEGRVEGRIEGREEGREEGRVREREEIILRMLGKRKYSLDEIAELTNFSVADIERLQGFVG